MTRRAAVGENKAKKSCCRKIKHIDLKTGLERAKTAVSGLPNDWSPPSEACRPWDARTLTKTQNHQEQPGNLAGGGCRAPVADRDSVVLSRAH